MRDSSEQDAPEWLAEVLALRADLQTVRNGRGYTKIDYFLTLGPPWSAAALAAFEAREGARLPDDCRAFLRHVGVGCAPSGYNGMVAPSRYTDDCDLARPFPLKKAGSKWRPDKRGGAQKTQRLEDGLLSVASLGCGYSAELVVTGACAGQVWHDYRAGDGKLGPDAPSFAAWYTKRMHDALREVLWGELSEATRTSPFAPARHPEILIRRAAIFDEPTGYLGGVEGHLLMPLYQGQCALARQRLRSIEARGHVVQPWLRQRIV